LGSNLFYGSFGKGIKDSQRDSSKMCELSSATLCVAVRACCLSFLCGCGLSCGLLIEHALLVRVFCTELLMFDMGASSILTPRIHTGVVAYY
jgi:hypothetical protein